ncbi:uncharacterized protein LOC135170579 isoform X2 [Diachasmimorpha longicaudata]|uniref:uncharacterized protein LOC135170579 isoform X2 n=1 Tax=Diachasmimorpha longicaudata TaxID=58733 RepID=UPI0030B9170D
MKEEETVPESQCGITSAKRNSHRSSRLYLKLNVVIVLTTFCMQIHAYEDLHNLTMDGFGDGEEDISMRAPSRISVVYNSSTNSSRSSDGFDSRKTRRKRSVVHLYNMVVCATGCNPLAYKGYGCYCGFLGSGYPVDGIDRCCWMHDRCYDATGCPTFSEYFIPYYWKCYRGHLPICAILHGSWGGPGSCAQRLCECDRALSKCLRRYPCPSSKAVCTSSPFRLVQNIFMIL